MADFFDRHTSDLWDDNSMKRPWQSKEYQQALARLDNISRK